MYECAASIGGLVSDVAAVSVLEYRVLTVRWTWQVGGVEVMAGGYLGGLQGHVEKYGILSFKWLFAVYSA